MTHDNPAAARTAPSPASPQCDRATRRLRPAHVALAASAFAWFAFTALEVSTGGTGLARMLVPGLAAVAAPVASPGTLPASTVARALDGLWLFSSALVCGAWTWAIWPHRGARTDLRAARHPEGL